MDDSQEILHDEPPSLVTTKRLVADADNHNFVLHIGDISYAEGFAGTVSPTKKLSLAHYGVLIFTSIVGILL